MFKLNIECTKDIDELHINFSDGTSIVSTSGNSAQEKIKKPKEQSRPAKQEQYLDVDAEFGGISQEVVEKPEIQQSSRPVKVAEELQNFDF